MRRLLIVFGVLAAICLLAWFQKIAIAKTILESQFDIQLELEDVDVSPGILLSARGTGFQLTDDELNITAGEVYVELRLNQLRSDGYYLAYLEARNGQVEFIKEAVEAAAQEDQEDTSESESEIERENIRWIPESFSLTNIDLHYLDEDQDIDATLALCASQRREDASEIDLDCTGQLQGTPINIVGRYGLPDPAGNAEPLDIEVNWGQYNLTAEGKLDAVSKLQGADLDLSFVSPNATPLLKLLGATEVREGIVDLQGSLKHQDSGFVVTLAGELSGITVSLDGTIGELRNYSPVEADFSFAGPSLFEVGALFNEFRLQPQAFSTTGHISMTEDRLTLSNVRVGVEQGLMVANVNMPGFPGTDGMVVDIKADSFKPNVLKPVADLCELPHEETDIVVGVTMTDQGQKFDLSLGGPSYDVTANGRLNESPGSASLDVVVTGTSLETLGQCLDLKLPDVAAKLDTHLHFVDNTLTLSNAHLSSELAEVSGDIVLEVAKDISYNANLSINVPDALVVSDAMANYSGPLANFPFRGNLELTGGPERLELTSFEFNAAGHEGSLAGTLGNPQNFEGLKLSLNMAGENLRHLISDAESSSDHVQPYRLETQFTHDADGWIIEGLDLELVNTTIKLDGRLTRLPMYLGSHLDIEASGDNIQNLIGPWVDHPLPELPFVANTSIDFTQDFFRFENLYVSVGEHELKADMSVDRPPDYSNTFGNLTLNGPSTAGLTELLGVDFEVLDRPYELSFNLKGDLDQLFVNDLKSRIAETDVSGQVVFQNKTPYYLDVDLVSNSLYLPLLDPSLIGEEDAATDKPDDERVFSDTTFPTSWMHAMEGEFTWDIRKAWTTEEYLVEILFDLALQDAELVGKNIHWDSDDSKGDLKFRMKETEGSVDITLDAKSSRLPLVWLLAGESIPSENTGFRALLSSEGNSLSSLMANLDGTLLWQGGSGRIQSSRLEFLFGDFITSTTSAIVGRQSAENRRTTLVSCTAGGIHFKDGTANLAPGIVSRTDRTDFYASGNIDLKDERLRLVFLTKSRTGIGLSPLKVIAPRLRVGGSMSDPRFSVDTTTSALSTSAAFFSGGVSVLATSLWDRMSSSSDACAQLQVQAEKMPEFGAHLTE